VLPLDLPSASARLGKNILEETNATGNNLAMSIRRQKGRKRRLEKQSPEILDPRAKLKSSPASIPEQGHRVFDFVEHPLFLSGLAVIAGIVGVFLYVPVLLICEVFILLALHRSNVLRGHGKFFQVTAYGNVFLLSGPLLLGLHVLVKKPARENLRIASGSKPPINVPGGNIPALPSSNLIPLPGGIFTSPAVHQTAGVQTPNVTTSSTTEYQPKPNSIEAALMREMRERLTRDAGDPAKIIVDVQWMREQFELGWSQEPPEQAKRHREETAETARLILASASNRAAVLQLVPHITIDK
jgi:hypothetical protein